MNSPRKKRTSQFRSKCRRGSNATAEMDWNKSKSSLATLDKAICNSLFISISLGTNYFSRNAENGATLLHPIVEPLDVLRIMYLVRRLTLAFGVLGYSSRADVGAPIATE